MWLSCHPIHQNTWLSCHILNPGGRKKVWLNHGLRRTEGLHNVNRAAEEEQRPSPPKKKLKKSCSQMAFEDSDEEDDAGANPALSSVCGELDAYLTTSLKPYATKETPLNQKKQEWNKNPLVFWKEAESQYPILAVVARAVFVIMPSSAAAERLFSWAGKIVSDMRQRLKSTTVEKLACLHLQCEVFEALAKEDNENLNDEEH